MTVGRHTPSRDVGCLAAKSGSLGTAGLLSIVHHQHSIELLAGSLEGVNSEELKKAAAISEEEIL